MLDTDASCAWCGTDRDLELTFVRPLSAFATPAAGMFNANVRIECGGCGGRGGPPVPRAEAHDA